jgi:hypothetical protein
MNKSERGEQVSGLYYKCFTIVIYDRNDSGQYYKTTITVKASLNEDHKLRLYLMLQTEA